MKARGRRANAFIVFECLETLMKHDALVFEVASQSRLRNKRKWKYSRIFHMLSASFLLREIVLYYNNVITMLWMIIKSRFNVEFFTLFCNGFTTFSASKISRIKRPSCWKAPCQSPLEQWQKQRLVKVPNVLVSGLFKDYDFHLVQSLDTSLIEMNTLSLNYWLSKFVQEVAKSSSVHGLL